jgi:tetratricopeptide (TPR) repeat protein
MRISRTATGAIMARKHGTAAARDFDFSGTALSRHWKQLHVGDCEPWPEDSRVQEAWRAFHSGDFPTAVRAGSALGAAGAVVANKAAAVETLYSQQSAAKVLQILKAGIARSEWAVSEKPDDANIHYTLALVLGRYSQRISILEALAQGLAQKVHSHLQNALELEPRHAEAHVALGLYHAEIVNKLGSIAARFTYGASAEQALEHFRKASRLAPASPIVQLERAHGLLLLDATRYRTEACALFAKVAALEPRDAMETQDVEFAGRELERMKSQNAS